MKEEKPKGIGPIPALACTIPYLLGMVLIYVGERLVGGPMSIRLALDGVGLACILWAFVGRAANGAGSGGDARSVHLMILAGYLGGLLALALYALQLEQVREALFPGVGSPEGVKRFRVILEVLWPIVWISSVLPVLFMEISFASMRHALRIERRRVAFSAGSALIVAWALSALFVINYLAGANNRQWDLSYQKTAVPSENARKMVSNLQEDLEVVLFFPDVNEVREEVFGYFEELGNASDRVRVRVCDQVLEPAMARDLGVQKNGTIVYRYGGRKEVGTVDLEKEKAQAKLSDLDQDFQKSFLKLVSDKKVAYLIAGHGERSSEWKMEIDSRPPVKGLKQILRAQNFDVKPLGIGQGLAAEVPDDASLLLIIDPTENYLPGEIRAIENYLDRGGRLMVVLDPDSSSNISQLLETYGVRFVGIPLGNDLHHVRVNFNASDRFNLYTNRTSSHPSVNTLSRNSTQLAAVLLRTGYLEKTDTKKGDARVIMTLRSMPDTWLDKGAEDKQAGAADKTKTYDLGAAVSMVAVEEEAAAAGGKKKEMKMLVYADADAFSDAVLGNLGNYYLFEDGLKWMFEDERPVAGVRTEKDVRIMHTKKENVVWFYATIFGVPVVVLGFGILYNQRRRRRAIRN